MSEKLKTQISSKYSPGNSELFSFKEMLRTAGIAISYPIGDEIIGYEEQFAITVPHEAELPFYSSEIRFLKNVKENPVHVVYNINGGTDGYIGESTSIETAYAMVFNKPIVLLRNPFFAQTVPPTIRDILSERLENLPIVPLDKQTPESIADYLHSLSSVQVDYNLTEEEKDLLMKEILRLCRDYSKAWTSFKTSRTKQG